MPAPGGGGAGAGLNRVQHLYRLCTGQQNYVLAVHANNNYSYMIVNQCGAGWGALRIWNQGNEELGERRRALWGVLGGGTSL